MEDETKVIEEDKTILAIKEEYEKKLEEQKQEYEKKIQDKLKEAEDRHISQIKALMTGREMTKSNPESNSKIELSFEEESLQELRNKFNIK